MTIQDLTDKLQEHLGSTLDVQVSPSTHDWLADATGDPFIEHLFLSFQVLDDENEGLGIAMEYLLPTAKALTRVINSRKMVEVRELQMVAFPPPQQVFFVGGVPFRLMMAYDGVRQKTVVTVDTMIRQVGNHYRRIINGPLHLLEMPFVDLPVDGFEFEHIYSPTADKRNMGGLLDEFGEKDAKRFPGLDWAATRWDSVHRYRVVGDYCYYIGETLYF